MSDRINELANIWREMISGEHHKHKDGYFWIECSWDYGKPARYTACHNAYIGESLTGPERGSFEVARQDLENHILELIREQYRWAKKVLSSGDEEWIAYSGEHAEDTIQVVEANIDILKGK